MASYLVLTLLTLFLCKWTTPVLGCEKKADCPEKDDGLGISGTAFVFIVLGGSIVFCIILTVLLCIFCPKGTGSGTSYGGGGGFSGGGDCGGGGGDGGGC